MELGFVDRDAELRELELAARKGGLLVVFGRRRVGKTRLLRRWLAKKDGLYTQAIEAQAEQQVQQTFHDLRPRLETGIVPKSWPELLEILALQKKRWTLCIDEFPYLAAVDSSLPSQLQKWVDHSMPKGCLLILAGSSTRMMNDLFLHRSAPLYGRAHKLLHVRPMGYTDFCEACALDSAEMDSFEQWSCVGGIPKYWEFVERGQDALTLAETLYFDFAPYMEQEPQRILRDECVSGMKALALLEAVGRGAERTSQIAGRLGTAQTGLSRLLQQLMDASILVRELPYGESVRSTKKILYRIQDPMTRFWFRVFSPHQSLWKSYPLAERRKLIRDHAASVFEDFCRARYPGAQRYWANGVEFDLVAPDPQDPKRLLVAEVKWRRLGAAERRGLLQQLEADWGRCALSKRHPQVRFELLDANNLQA
jgi:AAA+ ATPase superfamily predicted ATPase